MTSVDRILIDPTPRELEQALRQATDAVNRAQPIHGRALPCHPGDDVELWQQMRSQPEGARFWRVAGPALFSVEAELVAIWWSDFMGRRHLRLLGGSRHQGMELPAPLPSPHRPPLACVYPGACVVASQHRRPRLLAVCDCGAWGPPESLAWMGPHCGPCFDRGAGEWLASPAVLPAGGSVQGLAFAPDGRLAVWDQWGQLALWDLEAGRPAYLGGSVRPPGKLAFSPDGRRLACCSPAGRLRLVDLQTGSEVLRSGSAFTFTPTPEQLVVAEDATRLLRLDLALAQPADGAVLEYRLPFPIACRDLAVSPDGTFLAAAGGEQGLCLWDAHTGEPFLRADGACHEPLAWSPDGSVLAWGTVARFWKALLWDALTQQRRCVIGGTALLHALAFSPAGTWLVTAEEDAIRTWDVQTGQERQSLALPAGDQVLSLAFSPDGRTVALGMRSGRVRLWPAEMLRPEA